jgi:hypothetical protein
VEEGRGMRTRGRKKKRKKERKNADRMIYRKERKKGLGRTHSRTLRYCVPEVDPELKPFFGNKLKSTSRLSLLVDLITSLDL